MVRMLGRRMLGVRGCLGVPVYRLHTSTEVCARTAHHTPLWGPEQVREKEGEVAPTGHGQFSPGRPGDFTQPAPQHHNGWNSDWLLQSYMRRIIPRDIMESIEDDLERWGNRVATEVWDLGQQCEASPPRLEQTDAWGHRVDRLITCSAWKQQKKIAAEEGLIAIPYMREQAEYSRLYQVAKLYLYAPASGLYSCPLAMTDGAASTIESMGLQGRLSEAWSSLTSRDPAQFWTSGQWMTEKRGGSDVGGSTETQAVLGEDGRYRLFGYKWFSSATDSDMALTLARMEDREGRLSQGTRGLSMFYLKTRKENGELNGIQVAKLKNKLGTRQLPTAELLLCGAEAQIVGQEGRGVPAISNMLGVTRLHNTISATAVMRKTISLARDYATRRQAFGHQLDRLPLHVQSLARMEVETRGCCLMMLELGRQQGLVECGIAGDMDTLLLRLMTPVSKFYTAKAAVATVSEGLECFGGQGYIEDTGLPGMLRDAQVLPIWEGTSSVMAMDVFRALSKSGGEALSAFHSRVDSILRQGDRASGLSRAVTALHTAVTSLTALDCLKLPQAAARDLSVSLAHVYIGALLVEQAVHSQHPGDVLAAEDWSCGRDLVPVVTRAHRGEYSSQRTQEHRMMVYQMYPTQEHLL